MIINSIRISIFLLFISIANTSIAETYRYVDSQGIEHFTDDISKVPRQNQKIRATENDINPSLSGKVAPYTSEAKNQINKIAKEMTFTPSAKNIPTAKAMSEYVNHTRKVYRKAGYDYDATIRSIATDLKTNIDKIPKQETTLANEIVVGIGFMKSQAEYEGVDCYEFFDEKTAEAIRYIVGDKKSVKGEAAPYTADAMNQIERAMNNVGRNQPDPSKIQKDKLCSTHINLYRKAFTLAGFDYDSTISKIAADLRKSNNTIPNDNDQVANVIIGGLRIIKKRDGCFNNNNDNVFDEKTYESVKYILGNNR